MAESPIFVDGIVAAWNPLSGVGYVSLEGSVTRTPFGRSAVNDAERDKVRAGRRCRFALDEGVCASAPKVARLELA